MLHHDWQSTERVYGPSLRYKRTRKLMNYSERRGQFPRMRVCIRPQRGRRGCNAVCAEGLHFSAFHYFGKCTLCIEISLISSPSSPIIACETASLTCSIALPPGVTTTPVFLWEGPGVTYSNISGGAISSALSLSEIFSNSTAIPVQCK